jgi:hypothetical protein
MVVLLTNNAVNVGNAEDVEVTAQRVGVEQALGAEGVGTADDAVDVGGGSRKGGGEEEGGDGEELHFGGDDVVTKSYFSGL